MNVNDFRKLTIKKTRSKAELNAVFAVCKYLKLKGLLFMVDLKDKLNARQFAMYKGLTIDGMPDIIVLHGNSQWHGLTIEMKATKYNMRKAIQRGEKHILQQTEVLIDLFGEKYYPVMCAGFDAAKECIDNYLTIN